MGRRLRGHDHRLTALVAVALALLGSVGCAKDNEDEAPVGETVRAEAGGEVLEGIWTDEAAGIASFRGIPYAAPPIGELRWKPPAAVEPSSALRPAYRFAPRCPQSEDGARNLRQLANDLGGDADRVPALGETSEDCLYLNVWTSNLGGAQKQLEKQPEKQPVMVWIHGGSNIWGGGDESAYDGTALARRGVVVVNFNYRLGLLGFLAHPALSAESEHRASGNYGLLDQIAALKWVQDNIEAFGGDPERVTIFGASAGGADVLYLMASPLAKGLFHRAISQSGSPVADTRRLTGQERRGVRLEELLELQDSSDVLRDLRVVPVERLVEIGEGHLNGEFDCAPVTDGWALPDLPGRIFAAGKQHAVPLLIGTNSDEWASIGRVEEMITVVGFEGWLRSRWDGLAERAAGLYPASSQGEVEAALARWQTDHWFTCPARFAARSMGRVKSPAYLYEFTRSAPAAGGAMGAYHGAEMAYVFDNLAAESWVARRPDDQKLADAIADYWVRFAETGDPNLEGRPEWPPFDAAASRYLELGDEIAARSRLRKEACDLWDAHLSSSLELR